MNLKLFFFVVLDDLRGNCLHFWFDNFYIQNMVYCAGTYPNMQLAGESEGDGAATAILFPRMQGMEIEVLKVTRKSLTEGSIREALGIAETTDTKCVLLFGFGNTPASQFLATRLQTSFRESYEWDPVIAGAIADDLLTVKDLSK